MVEVDAGGSSGVFTRASAIHLHSAALIRGATESSHNRSVSEVLKQPCSKSDVPVKFVTSCQQVVPNFLTTSDKLCEALNCNTPGTLTQYKSSV